MSSLVFLVSFPILCMEMMCLTNESALYYCLFIYFSINSGGGFTSYSTVLFLFAGEVWLAGLNNVIICNINETSMSLE